MFNKTLLYCLVCIRTLKTIMNFDDSIAISKYKTQQDVSQI